MQVIEDAKRTLSAFVGSLEELEDREEEREAIQAFDEDAEKTEHGKAALGKAALIPWEESKRQRRQFR